MLNLVALVVLHQSLAVVPGLTLREQASTLLFDGGVQRALRLTPEQTRAIETAEKANAERREAMAKVGAPTDAAMLAADRQFAAEVAKPLSQGQRRALFVRAIKARGVASLADPEVATMVGLKGPALTRVQASVKAMDDRDGAASDAVANATAALPEPKTDEENKAYDAKVAALQKAAAPRLKARATARKGEEKAILASLPPAVRAAWARLSA